jgi:hypothetical protein
VRRNRGHEESEVAREKEERKKKERNCILELFGFLAGFKYFLWTKVELVIGAKT